MSLITYEKKDRVVLITMNRAEKLNALSPELVDALAECWIRFRDDEDAWVGVLTGAGRAFCAGVDIASSLKQMGAGGSGRSGHGVSMAETPAFRASPTSYKVYKPIIAAIRGHALGGGLWLALQCDIRYAAPDAKFGVPEPRLGAPATFTGLLEQFVPRGVAAEMLLSTDPIDAEKACQAGLIARIVPEEELVDTALEAARRICRNKPAGHPGGQGNHHPDQGNESGRHVGLHRSCHRAHPGQRGHGRRDSAPLWKNGGLNGKGDRAGVSRFRDQESTANRDPMDDKRSS